ncbi:MAG: porin family protein [Saprospiraceae bacterium]
MKNIFLQVLLLFLIAIAFSSQAVAQNRNFTTSLSLGIGSSGFDLEESVVGDAKRIFYPMGGIQFQKRLSPKWALTVFPNVGMSGNEREFTLSVGSLENQTIKSTSAFLNLAVHPKYFFNKLFYLSAGPELSYLLWNYGSAYNGDERIYNVKETNFFNRVNLLVSSSVGISMKVAESRKNAPVQIDALWYLEFRFKKGLTNILNQEALGTDKTTSIIAFELVTGISFASKK